MSNELLNELKLSGLNKIDDEADFYAFLFQRSIADMKKENNKLSDNDLHPQLVNDLQGFKQKLIHELATPKQQKLFSKKHIHSIENEPNFWNKLSDAFRLKKGADIFKITPQIPQSE